MKPVLSRPALRRPAAGREEPRPPLGLRRVGRAIDLRGSGPFRYARMITMLRFLTKVAFVAALAGVVLPDPVGTMASGVAVTVVIAAPLLRVAWLALRWYLRGDRRYAAVAAALLLVVASGSVIAAVTR
jgi:hypothetical protein